MKVSVPKIGADAPVFEAAEHSNGIVIETSSGAVFSIRENKDGTLDVNESTHLHLTVQPRASNAIQIGGVLPEAFRVTGVPQ
jgi:hypothetical protein